MISFGFRGGGCCRVAVALTLAMTRDPGAYGLRPVGYRYVAVIMEAPADAKSRLRRLGCSRPQFEA
jgi:hypothetical protein